VTPTPAQRVWGILRAGALDLLDAAIAATAGGVAGAIAFVTLGPGLLYLRYLSAATTSSLTEPGQNTQTGHFAASLSHPLSLAIMVVAFFGAVMVTWSTARAVAPYCR
jgi:hypothetical protein